MTKEECLYENLHNLLKYDKKTGEFFWKKTVNNNSAVCGAVAGSKNKNGYIYICVGRKKYLAHRLAWLFEHGYFPEHDIDHVNRIRDDNRLCNLREVSRQCNLRNSRRSKKHKNKIRGVCWSRDSNKWRSIISVNNKYYHIGYFDEFCEAVCHRLAVEQCLGWAGCDNESSAFIYVQKMIGAL